MVLRRAKLAMAGRLLILGVRAPIRPPALARLARLTGLPLIRVVPLVAVMRRPVRVPPLNAKGPSVTLKAPP